MKLTPYIGGILLIIIGVGCHTTTRVTATGPVQLNELTVSSNSSGQIFRGAAPRIWDLVHTDVLLSFNYREKTAKGKAVIYLRPHLEDTSLIILDAKGMRIDTVAALYHFNNIVKGAPVLTPRIDLLPYSYDGKELRIRLPKDWRQYTDDKAGFSFPYSNVIGIYISYLSMPYADSIVGGSSAITEDRGLYFINTNGAIPNKPAQIWTQGETESNSHWLPTIDKPNQRTTVKVSLIVPDSMQTLGNGEKLSVFGPKPGFKVDTWEMKQPIQPYAIMFAIGRFVTLKDEHAGVPVEYYVEPRFAAAGMDIFKGTPAMIDYFSKVTGVPYPWNKYSQVVVRDYVSGAMENTSASLFGEFMNGTRREVRDKTGNEDVVSHELFHQWFGDYVTAESWSNLTLNESFATYGEVLWRKASQGISSADELATEDLDKYLESTEDKDPPLVRYNYNDREDMFDRVSYQKGGAILRYLHGLMGDSAFSKSMKLYLTKNALQPAEAAQWRMAIEEVTGRDWMQFFNEFYLRGGHPELNITYNYDDAAHIVKVSTRQSSSLDSNMIYHLPLKAGILEGGKLRIINWSVNKRFQTDTIRYTGTRPVFLPDYYHWLPGYIIEKNKSLADYRQQFIQCGDYNNKRRVLQSTFRRGNPNDSALQIYKAALNDSISAITYQALVLLQSIDKPSWKEALTPQIRFLSTEDPRRRIRAAAFNVLGRWKDISGSLVTAEKATSDESYMVAGAALKALNKMQPDSAYATAKRLLSTEIGGDLENTVWDVIAEKGAAKDAPLFTAAVNNYYGTRKVVFAISVYEYALATDDDNAFAQAVHLLQSMLPNESIHGYRAAIGTYIYALEGTYTNAKGKQGKVQAITRLPILQATGKQVMETEKDPRVLEQYRVFRARVGVKS